MTKKSGYTTPAALRQALENRLQRLVEVEGDDLVRLRRHVAFDRFLARVFFKDNGPWLLKGGYSLELRLKEARATRDIDLTLLSPEGLPDGDALPRRLQAGLQVMAVAPIYSFRPAARKSVDIVPRNSRYPYRKSTVSTALRPALSFSSREAA